ncbi:hypothetical protein NC653_040027 [Populus alba x Populus x berolinensis]|uniref:NADP-dependent glyceraldehyde-3-phosphate dehydrogenase n=1 Tax=Populus alba x Populus x berolinensis TaxID=444605 RepID=A0AAD6PS39_9ROSI|nr:hypothetical protein NC653_040027 [Populus alba x Populus x berolinensis]
MAGTGVFSEILDGDAYKYYCDGEWEEVFFWQNCCYCQPNYKKDSVQACTQEEVNKVMELAKSAQKTWAKTRYGERAELLHKAAAILKEHKAPIAECLIKEIAKTI